MTRRRPYLIVSMLLAAAGGATYMRVADAQLVDPTRPPDYQPSAAEQGAAEAQSAVFQGPWQLTSTLVSAQRKLAVLNGQLVSKGTRVGDMIVLDISSGKVVLVGGGHIEVVKLSGETSIKKPARKGSR